MLLPVNRRYGIMIERPAPKTGETHRPNQPAPIMETALSTVRPDEGREHHAAIDRFRQWCE